MIIICVGLHDSSATNVEILMNLYYILHIGERWADFSNGSVVGYWGTVGYTKLKHDKHASLCGRCRNFTVIKFISV